MYPLKKGDRVRLTREAVALYGGAWPHWVPDAQGGGSEGTLVFVGERPHKAGAAPRPYYVHWDNGTENSYRVEDLMLVEDLVEDVKQVPLLASVDEEYVEDEDEDDYEDEDEENDDAVLEPPDNVVTFVPKGR